MDIFLARGHPQQMGASRKRVAMENNFSRVIGTLPGVVRTVFPEGYLDFFNQRWCGCTSICVDENSWFGRAPLYHEDLRADLEC
jgi:hypothetical protein